MDAWVEVFGTVVDGKKVLTTNNQSLVVSILSAGVSDLRTLPPASGPSDREGLV
jgi:hypothetical protein